MKKIYPIILLSVAVPLAQWSLYPISLPTGALLIFSSGSSCPLGSTEATNIADKSIIFTTIASGNVGTTGGSDNITPAGTNATSVVIPLGTNQALTFTGTSSTVVVNHLHTLATGTTATGNFSQVLGTVDISSGGVGIAPTQTSLATLSSNPTSGGAASYTPAGTINTPTFTGSSSTVGAQTFTGTQFDNRSAFIKVIVCRAN